MANTVDNSGQGNCMYYAYGISLMYFLRAKNDSDITDPVLARLHLEESQRAELHHLLANNRNIPFSRDDIGIIERILGPATRKLGAETTRKEFLEAPRTTSLFASATYGMEYAFKHVLEQKRSDLAQLIDNEFDDPTFTDAEIFRVSNINKTMREFWKAEYAHVIAEFNRQWGSIRAATTSHDMEFRKKAILSEIISSKTLEFFNKNRCAHLHKYITHLGTDFVWGNDETLLLLHRAIQGERVARDAAGRAEIVFDTPIKLVLYKNGLPATSDDQERPDIILNNMGQCHWVSLIQADEYRCVPPDDDLEEGPDWEDDEDLIDESSDNEFVTPVSEISDETDNQELEETPPGITSEVRDLRTDILHNAGFYACLTEIKNKAKRLEKDGYLPASQIAKELYNDLVKEQEIFLSGTKNLDSDISSFTTKSKGLVITAQESKLRELRGIGKALNVALNAILAIFTLGIVNIAVKKFFVVRPTTESIRKIDALDGSLTNVSSVVSRQTELKDDLSSMKHGQETESDDDDSTPYLGGRF